MKRVCKQCGREFDLSRTEIQFYKSRKLQLPKRCRECREANKQAGGSHENGGRPKKREFESVEAREGRKAVRPVEHRKDNESVRPAQGQKDNGSIQSAQEQKKDPVLQPQKPVYGESESAQRQASGGGQGGLTRKILIFVIAAVLALVFAGRELPKLFENDAAESSENQPGSSLQFRDSEKLEEHYQKHGIEMGFSSAQEYEAAAAAVVEHADVLHKTEAEDGDDVYYLERTNEFVIVSTDGYIRTYFYPDDGIEYFNRQ